MFRIPLQEETNYTDLLMKIVRDGKTQDLKIALNEFIIMCPRCKDEQEDITYIKASPEELAILNQTPLAKMWITSDL